jgi:hypothetical protein
LVLTNENLRAELIDLDLPFISEEKAPKEEAVLVKGLKGSSVVFEKLLVPDK